MNLVTEIAAKNGRDYITPEDVEKALNQNANSISKIQRDVLEVIGEQMEFGIEDIRLCAFVALGLEK